MDAAARVIEGIARACKESGCALIGGETAEMPGLYAKGDFDLAGFSVGAVERGHVLPRTAEMAAGDVLIGVASSGVHSNGYSLVRKLVEKSGLGWDADAPFAPGTKLGEALLTPTRLYVKSALEALRVGGVKGFAHITGGGITENLPRALPDGLDAEVDLDCWTPPAGVRLAGETAPSRRKKCCAPSIAASAWWRWWRRNPPAMSSKLSRNPATRRCGSAMSLPAAARPRWSIAGR